MTLKPQTFVRFTYCGETLDGSVTSNNQWIFYRNRCGDECWVLVEDVKLLDWTDWTEI
jgi:hypothetical protein